MNDYPSQMGPSLTNSYVKKLPSIPVNPTSNSTIDLTTIPTSSAPFTFVKMNYKIPPKEKYGTAFAPLKVDESNKKKEKIIEYSKEMAVELEA